MTKVILIGAGGHAKVIADIIEKSGDNIYGFLDDNQEIGTYVNQIKRFKVIGKISECIRYAEIEPNIKFLIAIGNNKIRNEIAQKYNQLPYYTAIHPSAILGLEVEIGEGTVIMAGTVINSCTKIGKHCIINTSAVVEHDNRIEDFVHISPNVSLGGTVKIMRKTHIGIGAIVKNNIHIASNNIIGAGAVVTKNIIDENKTYIGIPAKEMV